MDETYFIIYFDDDVKAKAKPKFDAIIAMNEADAITRFVTKMVVKGKVKIPAIVALKTDIDINDLSETLTVIGRTHGSAIDIVGDLTTVHILNRRIMETDDLLAIRGLSRQIDDVIRSRLIQ